MKRLLFIYNPMAGKGMIRNSLSYILEEFSGNGYEVVVHPTIGAKDATRAQMEEAQNQLKMMQAGEDK